MMTEAPSPGGVAAQVAALPTMPMKDLWAMWDAQFPRRPNHWNRDYLESRLAHRLQEIAYGKLPEALEARLLKLGAAESKFNKRRSTEVHLTPGTTLLREYGEAEYRVLVTPDGLYELNGKRFKSLSAVARHITGGHWSGPRFFGLLPSQKEAP